MNWRARIREYLVFNRNEKRGILLWMVLLVLIILFPFIYRLAHPGFQPASVEWTELVKDFESRLEAVYEDSSNISQGLERYDTIRLFRFDPNRLAYQEWLALGFTPRQARTAHNYIISGGRFRIPEDLRKIYGLEKGQYEILEPYIFIPSLKPDQAMVAGGGESPVAAAGHRIRVVEINSADSLEMEALPGIGPVLASRLVRYRELLGGFHSRRQLGEVYGLDTALLAGWEERIVIDTLLIRKIDLNHAAFGELYRHPYLDYHQAVSLLRYREKSGGYLSLDEITKNRLLPDTVLLKIRPYLEIGSVR